MRWVVVGASRVAQRRMIPAILANGGQVVSLVTGSPEHGRTIAAELSIGVVDDSLGSALSRGADAVYVANHHEHHATAAAAALAAGVPVLCEKPLAVAIPEARRVVELARSAGQVLGVNHHLRAQSVLRRARQRIMDGDIGDVCSVVVRNRVHLADELRGWRLASPFGGVVHDLATHDVDLVRFLIGREVSSVRSVCRRSGAGAVPVDVMTTARLGDTAILSLHESYDAAVTVTSVEVHGVDGDLQARDCLRPYPGGDLALTTRQGTTTIDRPPRSDLDAQTIRAFERAVHGIGQPLCSGADGLAAVVTAEAINNALEAP